MPFTKEIFLVACHVAGTGYRDVKAVEPELAIGDFLVFKRKPKNPHDPLAIAVFAGMFTNGSCLIQDNFPNGKYVDFLK